MGEYAVWRRSLHGQTSLSSLVVVLFIHKGQRFIGSIRAFGEEVANDIRNVFEKGEVSQLLNGERVQAFDQSAQNIASSLTDGKITLNTLVETGKAIGNGIILAGEFIVAGVRDFVRALGVFFQNVFRALGDFFNVGSSTW